MKGIITLPDVAQRPSWEFTLNWDHSSTYQTEIHPWQLTFSLKQQHCPRLLSGHKQLQLGTMKLNVLSCWNTVPQITKFKQHDAIPPSYRVMRNLVHHCRYFLFALFRQLVACVKKYHGNWFTYKDSYEDMSKWGLKTNANMELTTSDWERCKSKCNGAPQSRSSRVAALLASDGFLHLFQMKRSFVDLWRPWWSSRSDLFILVRCAIWNLQSSSSQGPDLRITD